jgi:hypothetical protein
VPVVAAGRMNASAGISGELIFSFLFGIQANYDPDPMPLAITEAGLFVNSLAQYEGWQPGNGFATGNMFNHSTTANGVGWYIFTQLMTLTTTFTFGNS